jgi:hypothetical protein
MPGKVVGEDIDKTCISNQAKMDGRWYRPQHQMGDAMTVKMEFKCFRSVSGGFVAFGKEDVSLHRGGHARKFWFCCQAEKWEDLEGHMRAILKYVPGHLDLNPYPVESTIEIKEWPSDQKMKFVRGTNYANALIHLVRKAGPRATTRSGDGGITDYPCINGRHLVMVNPVEKWKPEVVSFFFDLIWDSVSNGAFHEPGGFEVSAEDYVWEFVEAMD